MGSLWDSEAGKRIPVLLSKGRVSQRPGQDDQDQTRPVGTAAQEQPLLRALEAGTEGDSLEVGLDRV